LKAEFERKGIGGETRRFESGLKRKKCGSQRGRARDSREPGSKGERDDLLREVFMTERVRRLGRIKKGEGTVHLARGIGGKSLDSKETEGKERALKTLKVGRKHRT